MVTDTAGMAAVMVVVTAVEAAATLASTARSEA